MSSTQGQDKHASPIIQVDVEKRGTSREIRMSFAAYAHTTVPSKMNKKELVEMCAAFHLQHNGRLLDQLKQVKGQALSLPPEVEIEGLMGAIKELELHIASFQIAVCKSFISEHYDDPINPLAIEQSERPVRTFPLHHPGEHGEG